MGGIVGPPEVAKRLWPESSFLLELGGNNAIVVSNNADLNLALGSILFGAVGTAGEALHHHTARDCAP